MKSLKEAKINEIIQGLAPFFAAAQLQIIEGVIVKRLYDVDLSNQCTDLSTYLDDNEYILEVFAANKKLENLSDKSIAQYVSATRMMLNTLNKNYRDITTNDIKYYLVMYQQRRKITVNTVVNLKRFLGAFFSWAQEEEYIDRNPVAAIRGIKTIDKPIEYLTPDEVEAMRDACQTAREKALVDLLLSTGLRVSELEGLTLDTVNLTAKEAVVYMPKTRKYKTVFISAKACRHLRDYIGSRTTGPVFLSERKPYGMMHKEAFQRELQAVASRAGLHKHVTVHLLRKTFATMMLQNGCALETISELLGHANTAMTQKHYACCYKEDIKAAHRKHAA